MYEIKFISTAGNYFLFKDGKPISLDPNFKEGQDILRLLNSESLKKKTILSFDLVRLGIKDFSVDPDSIYINGFFNWYLLNDFLFGKNTTLLSEIGSALDQGECKGFEMEIWEDSDDYKNWIDYKIINQELLKK